MERLKREAQEQYQNAFSVHDTEVGNRPYKDRQVSLRLRFKIFARDNFTCVYCGRKPPEATLVIDHIQPVVDGGKTVPDNLTTACFECNNGKNNSKP